MIYMKTKMLVLLAFIVLNLGASVIALAKPINIVAAENFYGNIAKQLGGPYVNVFSILNNPNQDPHLFSANPSTAKAIANANIIIYNGANYDPWMEKLVLNLHKQAEVKIIVIAKLLNIKTSDNPHIWYDPTTIPRYASSLAVLLTQMDPAHRNYYNQQLDLFIKSYGPLLKQVAHLRQLYQNTPVIATEPVFNYMATAIGLKIHGNDFQLSVMNDVPPSASQIRTFEQDLETHAVRVLLYNNQVNNPLTTRLHTLAHQVGIPVVGISETQPTNKSYIQWMQDQLHILEQALEQT